MRFIQAKTLQQWIKIYKLYKKVFPKYERKPFWLILQTKRHGKTDIWYIEDQQEFAGLAITMNSEELVLLDYFAISEERRGCGIGSESLAMLQQKYAGKKFFLEIESVYEEADNLPERKRRKQFYLANKMTEMKVMVTLFGVKMELLGYDCQVDFDSYYSLYRELYGEKAARFVVEADYPPG